MTWSARWRPRRDVADHVDLPPLDTALDDPFLALVAESLEAVGLPAEPAPPARYFTDASALGLLLAERGSSVPTVVLGPGEPEQCVADEWCSVSRVDEAVAVYAELLDRWCGSATDTCPDGPPSAREVRQPRRARPKLDDVVGRQLDDALRLDPDLVSVVGGGNDILRPRADVDALAARLERAVATLRATGADVLMVTPVDLKGAPVIRHTRGRVATYTAHIHSIARRHGAYVVDQA